MRFGNPCENFESVDLRRRHGSIAHGLPQNIYIHPPAKMADSRYRPYDAWRANVRQHLTFVSRPTWRARREKLSVPVGILLPLWRCRRGRRRNALLLRSKTFLGGKLFRLAALQRSASPAWHSLTSDRGGRLRRGPSSGTHSYLHVRTAFSLMLGRFSACLD